MMKAFKIPFITWEEDVERWKKQILDEWDMPGKNYKSLDFDMTALNTNGQNAYLASKRGYQVRMSIRLH